MEIATMGRVLTEATIENLKDLWDAQRGLVAEEQVRRITVSDALVDTGATLLTLPTRLIRQLGLNRTSTKRITNFKGKTEADMYEAVRHHPRPELHDGCPRSARRRTRFDRSITAGTPRFRRGSA